MQSYNPVLGAVMPERVPGLRLSAVPMEVLGAVPIAAGVTIVGVTTAIMALAALVQNALDDDWTDKTVFQANMRKIHSSMLAMQCIVGGSQEGQPLVDTLGNEICPGGTKPLCTVSDGKLTQWRTLRDGFSKFWSDVKDSYFGPSNADAQQAKRFARDFFAFYNDVTAVCQKQGVQLEKMADPVAPPPQNPAPEWVKYAAWGVGAVAIISLAVAAKSIWGK